MIKMRINFNSLYVISRYRSKRERWTWSLVWLAACVVWMMPAVLNYSLAQAYALVAPVLGLVLASWLAWLRWGRGKFPLRDEPTSA